jgi:hypothetical protein
VTPSFPRAPSPVGKRPASHPGRPLWARLAQVVREHVGRSRSVRAVHGKDGPVGELRTGVQRREARVAPALDFSEKDRADRLAIETKGLGHFGKVVGQDDRPDHRGNTERPRNLGQVLLGEGSVRRPEVDRALDHLPDAASRPHRLVIYADRVVARVDREPTGVDRIGEGRPSPRERDRSTLSPAFTALVVRAPTPGGGEARHEHPQRPAREPAQFRTQLHLPLDEMEAETPGRGIPRRPRLRAPRR